MPTGLIAFFALTIIPEDWNSTKILNEHNAFGLTTTSWLIGENHHWDQIPLVRRAQCKIHPDIGSMDYLCVSENWALSWTRESKGVIVSFSKLNKHRDELSMSPGLKEILESSDDNQKINISIRTTSLSEMHLDLLSYGFHNNWSLILNDVTEGFMLLSWLDSNGLRITQTAHKYTKDTVLLSTVVVSE